MPLADSNPIFIERELGVGGALRAQQGLPERLVEGAETRFRNRLLVEPEKVRRPPLLRQPQPFVARHPALRAAYPLEAPARAVVPAVASRRLDHQERPALLHLLAKDGGPERGLDRVRAHLHQQPLQFVHPFAGHSRYAARVGHPAEQYSAIRIGEGGNLVSQVVAARSDRAIPPELDLLELPHKLGT